MEKENLIQIIGYRPGIHTATGKQYVKQLHYDNIIVTSSLGLLNNLPAIIEMIPVNERWDLHYTNARCLPPSTDVPKRSFYKQDIIPIDIDEMDLHRADQYIDIVLKTLNIDRNKTGIYCSGNGIHMIVVLPKEFDLEGLLDLKPYYKQMCNVLNMAFYEAGLPGKVDPVRLAESATLRLPLTENRKDRSNPKMATIIQGNVEPQNLDLKSMFQVTIKEVQEEKLYSVDTPAVLTGCNFLKWCKENPNQVSEPLWHRMIAVLSCIPDIGESLCHTYSKDAVSYDEIETDNKYAQAREFRKPATCDGIDQLWNRCSECPYYKKVKTPLQIRGEEFIATEQSGFHHVTIKKDGSPVYKPDYEGLAAYFGRQYPYTLDQDTGIVMKFTGKKWEEVLDCTLSAFATKHFNPTATNLMRSEFVGLVKNKHISERNFLGKDNIGYINFNNGVLKLNTKELIPHSPTFGFTYVLPYDYNPQAKCPNFEAMMAAVTLNDPDLTAVILEFVGYMISGRPNSWIQKVMVLSGEGSNGKSTFMNIIRRLVGEECYSAISIASMCKENNRFAMLGKLFNISFDEDPKALLKGGINIFKAITAGDPLDIRRLYANPISAPINAKLIIACNKPLETNDHTHAVYRRMLIIPFRAKFEGANDNKNITKGIDGEMSGIYNLILKHLERLVANDGNFTKSTVVENAFREYKYESAIYQRFFEDCFEITKDKAHFVSINEIMSRFQQWCNSNNERSDISSIKLLKELRSLGLINADYADKYQNKRGYRGIKDLNNNF